MNCKIVTSKEFDKNAKRLAKKHKSLKQDLKGLFEKLEQDPRLGIVTKENTYKIRLAIKRKGKKWWRSSHYLCGSKNC